MYNWNWMGSTRRSLIVWKLTSVTSVKFFTLLNWSRNSSEITSSFKTTYVGSENEMEESIRSLSTQISLYLFGSDYSHPKTFQHRREHQTDPPYSWHICSLCLKRLWYFPRYLHRSKPIASEKQRKQTFTISLRKYESHKQLKLQTKRKLSFSPSFPPYFPYCNVLCSSNASTCLHITSDKCCYWS